MVFQIGFAICLFSVSAVVITTATRNQIALQPLQKLMLLCWIGYLLALLFATLKSASTYSLIQWCFLFAKFLFFAFLLLYLNSKYIISTLRIYANLMVATVFFALAAILLPANSIPPFTTVDLGGRLGHVYLGAYIVHTDFICPPAPIFRIQGLTEEPGTYAFILLPAFFWLLIVETAYLRAAVIVLGLMFSYSLGAGLFLLMLLPLMLRKYTADYKVPSFFIAAICAIGLMYVASSYCRASYAERMGVGAFSMNEARIFEREKIQPVVFRVAVTEGINEGEGVRAISDEKKEPAEMKHKEAKVPLQEKVPLLQESIGASLDNKVLSLQDRIDGLLAVSNYLKDNWMGTGAALGMSTVKNSISVGYAVAVLESGIIGGIFYLGLFLIMGWLALKTVIALDYSSFEKRVRVVVALSVCAVLVMGAQRMQPDLSWWHMWIYAMWFYLLQNGSRETGGSQAWGASHPRLRRQNEPTELIVWAIPST